MARAGSDPFVSRAGQEFPRETRRERKDYAPKLGAIGGWLPEMLGVERRQGKQGLTGACGSGKSASGCIALRRSLGQQGTTKAGDDG